MDDGTHNTREWAAIVARVVLAGLAFRCGSSYGNESSPNGFIEYVGGNAGDKRGP